MQGLGIGVRCLWLTQVFIAKEIGHRGAHRPPPRSPIEDVGMRVWGVWGSQVFPTKDICERECASGVTVDGRGGAAGHFLFELREIVSMVGVGKGGVLSIGWVCWQGHETPRKALRTSTKSRFTKFWSTFWR